MSTGKTSPGPWRWGDDYIYDANGYAVIIGQEWGILNPADRVLIASAPTLSRERDEAVELLREEVAGEGGNCMTLTGQRCEYEATGGCWYHRASRLLARIDGAATPAPPTREETPR